MPRCTPPTVSPAAQLLAESAAALQRVLQPDGPPWEELPDHEKQTWAAYASPSTLTVLMITKPKGWEALFAEITGMASSWAKAYPNGGPRP